MNFGCEHLALAGIGAHPGRIWKEVCGPKSLGSVVRTMGSDLQSVSVWGWV